MALAGYSLKRWNKMGEQIRNKRVVNIAKRLEGFASGAEIRIVAEVNDRIKAQLRGIGFPEEPSNGMAILPPPLGPVSRFNSQGKWLVHRDQPKELRYMWTVHWTWKQWTGGGDYEIMEDYKDIHRMCYPRELISPPSLDLIYTELTSGHFIVSKVFINSEDHMDNIRHAVNLFLEIFGECEIVGADLEGVGVIPIKRANWRFLPPGQYPWDTMKGHLDVILRRRSERIKSVIKDRQEEILSHDPDEVYTGENGFQEYLAYVFKSYGLVVLESIHLDNALYVFGKNWEEASQLTKAEVISGNLHIDRIIHTKGWKQRLVSLLLHPKAAE